MPRISTKNGVFVAKIEHGGVFWDAEANAYSAPVYPNLTPQEIADGIVHVDITDDAYWSLVDARTVSEQPYQMRRASMYPAMQEGLDAKVKMSSPDPNIRAEGIAQWDRYTARCLEVKRLIPKT